MFNIVHENANGSSGHNNTLKDIQARKIDGIIFKNFLNKDEVAIAGEKILSTTCDISTETPYGKIIGKKMRSENGNFQELPFEEYLESAEQFKRIMPSIVGFDLENRFQQFCAEHTDTAVSVPVVNGRSYIPATIRSLVPQGGGIIAHVGNGFIDKMNEINGLRNIADPYNQLSFFCVVQLPDEGGELVLFDATWQETDGLGLSFEESSEYIKSKEKQTLKLKEGDLIIFAAGEIWHEVTPIHGNRNRITIGGFIAPSTSGSNWYFWS